MSFVMAYYSVACAVILITHEAISPVRGQCTVQGYDNNDPLISIFGEMIRQLRVDLFDQLNKQVQSIHERFDESFQEIKSQHDVIATSLQAVHRRLEENDISTRNQTRNSLEKHDISIRNQTRNSWTSAYGCAPASDVCDCSDMKARGHTRSGVYEVCVVQQHRICTFAFCDMEATNGASLVFQKRKDGSVNFSRTWAEYRAGFGNRNGEFWLGNEMLYLLTSKRNYKLRVDLEDWEGEKRYAEYSTFSINSSVDKYRLTIGGYSGNAGDSLLSHNGNQFSTIDADNDDASGDCARTYYGGWWYRACFHANLNGIYRQRNGTFINAMGIHWYNWRHGSYSLKATEMKLVPVT